MSVRDFAVPPRSAHRGAVSWSPASKLLDCKSQGEALSPINNLQSLARMAAPLALVPVLALVTFIACDGGAQESRKHITPEYDKESGKLKLLKYDSNANGIVDTWSYMDGARVIRIEIDKDEDGKIERWEYYGPDQKLEKVGFSRENDGKEDAWSFAGPDGTIARLEISTHRDGKISRSETYEHEKIVRAEEDTDGDGRPDKWETYVDAHLASVAFDTLHRGSADRRLVYGANGAVTIEVDPDGDGTFTTTVPQSAIRNPR